jgi:hypothetical protein
MHLEPWINKLSIVEREIECQVKPEELTYVVRNDEQAEPVCLAEGTRKSAFSGGVLPARRDSTTILAVN